MSTNFDDMSKEELARKNLELTLKLNEAEETLSAIQNGEIDAIVTNQELESPNVYTLESADHIYRILVQEMNEGVATLTPKGTIFYSNNHLASLIQVPLEKLSGQMLENYVAKEDLTKYQNMLTQGLKTRTKGEIYLQSVNGTKIPVYISINSLTDLIGVYVVITDLSEEKTHEKLKGVCKELKESLNEIKIREKKFRALYENSLYGVLLIKDTHILGANPAAEKIFGYSESELLNIDVNKIVDLDDSQYKNIIKQIEKTNKADGELVLVSKKGKKFPTEISMNFFGDIGDQRASVVIKDITQRKNDELQLQKHSDVLESINLVFKESLNLKTEEDIIQTCVKIAKDLTKSEYGFFKYPNGKCVSDNGPLISYPWKSSEKYEDMDKKIEEYCETSLKEDKSQIINEPLDDKSYTEHPVIISILIIPLKQDRTNVIGHLVLLKNEDLYNEDHKNIVEAVSGAFVEALMRKRGEITINENLKNMARSNNELEQYANIISHDLREPLRMITSFLQLLERKYEDELDNDAHDYIEFAVNGAKRLNNMINDLLEYSRVSSEKRQFQTISTESVIEETVQNLTIPIEESGAIVTHEPLPHVYGDENLLVQLFQNLIANSIKYRGKKTPNIHISAVTEPDNYVFSVKDNGMGIDAKNLDNIFTIFHRLHSNDEFDGTGIGLSIVKKIVHEHGGEIWVESEPDIRTEFYFTIPIQMDKMT
jgi:PAS domain S-box-containing protein